MTGYTLIPFSFDKMGLKFATSAQALERHKKSRVSCSYMDHHLLLCLYILRSAHVSQTQP